MLNYENIFFSLFNKLIKTEKYTDSWAMYEGELLHHQSTTYDSGWELRFRFYKDNMYNLHIGYIPKFNILTINDRGKCLELTPKKGEKIINCMKQLYDLFQKLCDNLLLEAIKE